MKCPWVHLPWRVWVAVFLQDRAPTLDTHWEFLSTVSWVVQPPSEVCNGTSLGAKCWALLDVLRA